MEAALNMADDSTTSQAQADATDDESRRERSTIEFPYMDLGTALTVANAVYARNGKLSCQHDELAHELSLSPNSSGYRTRISTAKIFGLISSDRGSDEVKLTGLGSRAVDRTTKRKAKVDAFLSVALYRALYDQHRGQQLPPTAALHRELEGLGVSPKQVERARQVMERSAEAAGFFEGGRDRLIMPAKLGHEDNITDDTSSGGGNGSDRGGGNVLPVDPIIAGLLARLPASGANWPGEERKLWLDLLEGSFKLIYRDEGSSQKQQSTKDPEKAFE
jgi:hypothetical protein